MKIHCFTHWDLDGVVSYLALKWCLGIEQLPYTTIFKSKNFREDFTKWLLNNKVEEYDKIFILDLDLSSDDDLIDKKNIVIIDHHESHFINAKYKNAKAYIDKDCKSAAEVIYKTFKKIRDPNLTDAQKKLIIYASDYDSYTLQFPESLKLNVLFGGTQNSFECFIKQFNTGYHGLTLQQENMYKLYNTEVENLKQSTSVFHGKFNIGGKERNVYAAFAEKYINEVSDYLIKEYKADISMVVCTKKNKVSLRKNHDLEDIDLIGLAEKLLKGGGHKYASGGEITPEFQTLTKRLTQIR